jgi:hypothetical protein
MRARAPPVLVRASLNVAVLIPTELAGKSTAQKKSEPDRLAARGAHESLQALAVVVPVPIASIAIRVCPKLPLTIRDADPRQSRADSRRLCMYQRFQRSVGAGVRPQAINSGRVGVAKFLLSIFTNWCTPLETVQCLAQT